MNAVPTPTTIVARPSAQERRNTSLPDIHCWPIRVTRSASYPRRGYHICKWTMTTYVVIKIFILTFINCYGHRPCADRAELSTSPITTNTNGSATQGHLPQEYATPDCVFSHIAAETFLQTTHIFFSRPSMQAGQRQWLCPAFYHYEIPSEVRHDYLGLLPMSAYVCFIRSGYIGY